MDLAAGPSPAVRITVLLRLASEGFQDAFATEPAWVEAPAGDYEELRGAIGADKLAAVEDEIGLRPGSAYRAGGPLGTVALAPAALAGVLGLLGLEALPPDVQVEQAPDGPRYAVPEDWFLVQPAGEGGGHGTPAAG